MDKTSLGDRMKRYEAASDAVFMRRVPVIVRVDGKGFSRWIKKANFEKPFDKQMAGAMQDTMQHVAENVEGCVFGYTQSDEMTFVLRNDQSFESEPWFGNRQQKIVSVISSMVTAYFNDCFDGMPYAYFDARAFTVPDLDEAANCLVWRQQDATKNSISMASYYGIGQKIGKGAARKALHGLNGNQQQELLFQETGQNWNYYPTWCKRGAACYRKLTQFYGIDGGMTGSYERKKWIVDKEIPVFTQEREWLMRILGEVSDYVRFSSSHILKYMDDKEMNEIKKPVKTRTLLVDMDCILVDMIPPWLDRYNEECGTNVTVDDIKDYDMGLVCKNEKVFYGILQEPGFFHDMRAMPGAISGMRQLIELGYDIKILTRPPDQCRDGIADKQLWIKERFPELATMRNQVFTAAKDIVWGDLLFDDCPDHLIHWKERWPNSIAATLDWQFNRKPEVNKVISFRGDLNGKGWSDFVDFVREVLPLK